MSEPRLMGYQKNNINKLIERVMQVDFSNLAEVKELRRKLIDEVTNNMNFHIEMHTICVDYHDCNEYESRNNFGRKILRILDKTIRELENGR